MGLPSYMGEVSAFPHWVLTISMLVSDRDLVACTVVVSGIVYAGLSLLYSLPSQVPLLTTVFLACNMLTRTNLFARLVKNAKIPLVPNLSRGNDRFTRLLSLSQEEVLSAIKSLESYAVNARRANDRRRKLFRLMSWRQQKLCDDAGYSAKLNRIDQCINDNQKLLAAIAETATTHYGLTFADLNAHKASPSGNVSATNYRVIEALGHFVRDWTPKGEAEIKDMVDYIITNLCSVIPEDAQPRTAIVVPGSGLGRVAHNIALAGSWQVHAVEFSGLMHVCNQYMYTGKSQRIYPYVHLCSNLIDIDSQFRYETIEPARQPSNLHLHHHDFRYFSIPDKQSYDNVVVVSAFFIDTAENLIDYFDAINDLTTPSRKNHLQNGYWINVGPLKYGSAAQCELSAEEITAIRSKMGWRDDTAVADPSALTGYITDKQLLWQGYYGTARWVSRRKENKAKK